MKKVKKRRSSALPESSAKSSSNISGPDESFINEMMGLFNGGKFKLFEQRANEAIQRWPRHFLGWKALGNLRLVQGRIEEALELFTKSVQLAPGDSQALNNLGSVLLELGRLEEAEENFKRALDLTPDYVQAHNNLGITCLRLGRFEEALASYRQALAISPNYAEAHNNLGNALKNLGRLKEAEESFRQALIYKPDFAEAHNNLGNVLLEELGSGESLDKAKKSFRMALKINPSYARAHGSLGDILLKQGRLKDAIVHYRKCIDLDPLWVQAHSGLSKALGVQVPAWHVPMMNDKQRNDAYFKALQRAITPDTHVLEIGTGSGLLAMMAAKLGAKQVTTCEAISEIAETARDIVADNGFTPPVTVIPKMSTKLKIGTDMDDRADLLVSEILSSEFLGEGVFSSIEDAKLRLLKPDARIIPAGGSIQFALFGGTDIGKNIRVEEVYGFDLSRFNRLVAQKQYVHRSDLNIELLTDDTSSFSFDFVKTDRFPPEETMVIDVPVRKGGRCCGIIQWIKLEMDDEVIFENHPSIKNPSMGWQYCVYIFPKAIDILPGQVAIISATHNRNSPWFFFEGLK